MSRVILHLGTHKAASTAIQMYWSRNRGALVEAGFCYPQAPDPTPIAHHSLAWNLRAKYVDVMRRPGNQSLEEVLEAFSSSGAHSLLLSSEDFLTTSFFEGFLEEFSTVLRHVFDSIVVCAYVRGRRDFFNSSYNQWIKSLSFADDFDTYLASNLATGRPQIHFTKALTAWGSMADEAIFIPFKGEIFGEAPELYLSQRLGLNEELLESFLPVRATAMNESIGPDAIVAYRQLAARLHAADWYEHFDIALRKKLLQFLDEQARQRGWTGEKFKPLEERHRQQIQAVFGDEDREFAERFFAANWYSLFPQDHEAVEMAATVESFPSATAEIDSFVAEGFAKADAIYHGIDDEAVADDSGDGAAMDAGDNPDEVPRDRRGAETDPRPVP